MSDAMAFVTPIASPLSFSSSVSRSLTAAPRPQWLLHAPRMTSMPPESQTSTKAESSLPTQSESEGYDIDMDAWKSKARGIFNDLGTRPLYYGKIAGYAVGGLVTITVLRAVVVAVDSLPVLPGALELIGLGYTSWFVWRYVLFRESREELLEEIEEFLGRAKPNKH